MTRSHVAPHFNSLDLRNAMMPLTTASCGTTAGGNGVTDQVHVVPDVDWYWCKKCIGAIDDTTDTDANSSGITWPKYSCCTSVAQQVLKLKGIQWCHWWCFWQHMTLVPVQMVWIITKSCCIWSLVSWHKKCNDAIDGAIQTTWFWH